jgi:hypothetical protein
MPPKIPSDAFPTFEEAALSVCVAGAEVTDGSAAIVASAPPLSEVVHASSVCSGTGSDVGSMEHC